MKQSGLAAQLSKTLLQMVDTRFSSVYLSLKSIQDIYAELQEKLEACGEGERVDKVPPDTLAFLVDYLKPFWDAQRELEGDKYPTLHRVCLWTDDLKAHCQPNALDNPQQAFVRARHAQWLAKKIQREDLHLAATFLWPNYNQLRMLDRSERERVHEYVKMRLAAAAAAVVEEGDGEEEEGGQLGEDGDAAGAAAPPPRPPPVAQRARRFGQWENVFGEEENEEDEVESYIRQRATVSDDKGGLLDWWKNNQKT